MKRLAIYEGRLKDRIADLERAHAAAAAARTEADLQTLQSARAAIEQQDALAVVTSQVEATRTALDELAAVEGATRDRVHALEGTCVDLELKIDLAGSEVANLEQRKATLRKQADEAERARVLAEAARLAAETAAADAIRKGQAERAEAARAMARAGMVTSGLAALTKEMAAGTLGLREDGRVSARAPDRLRPAYPEIGPSVRAAATVAEMTRVARREAEDVTRKTAEERKKAVEEIAFERAAAAAAIAQEREAARIEIDKRRSDLDQQEAELKKKWTLVDALLERLPPLLTRVLRWLSRPELPASMKDEGIDIVAEGFGVLGALRKDDPAP